MNTITRTAPALALLLAGVAHAGVETVPVTFSISATTDLFGDFTISADFDATVDGSGSSPVVSFSSKSGSFSSNSPFDFTYSDLSMVLDGDFIDGTFGMSVVGGTVSADILLSGFGSAWDGTVAAGDGIIEIKNIGGGGFAPETTDITWSITTVPAPGALGLLGVAGLARRRRRD